MSLGVFTFERATKNTKRFSRENDDGRSEVQYVQSPSSPSWAIRTLSRSSSG